MILYDLQVENTVNPLSVDFERPRFSWKLSSEKNAVMQTEYRIQVARKSGGKPLIVWDSGLVACEDSLYIPYSGDSLVPCTQYSVRIEVRDNHNDTAWATTFFETGLLSEPWNAQWIAAQPFDVTETYSPCVLFRKEIELKQMPVRARLYATALGLYSAHINQAPAGDTFLNPGFTSYNKEHLYQAYDVTNMLHEGQNRLEFLLTEGWYNSAYTHVRIRDKYGKRNAVLFRMLMEFEDGTSQTVVSDGTINWSFSPIQLSHIYDGEIYDARLEPENQRNWSTVDIINHPANCLRGQAHEPIRKVEERPAMSLFVTPKGERVLDLGQNMVGFVRLNLSAKEGDRVELHYFETLDSDGNAYFDNLKNARQELKLICRDGEIGRAHV